MHALFCSGWRPDDDKDFNVDDVVDDDDNDFTVDDDDTVVLDAGIHQNQMRTQQQPRFTVDDFVNDDDEKVS